MSAVDIVRKGLVEAAGGTSGREACRRGTGRMTLPAAELAVVVTVVVVAVAVGVSCSDNLSVVLIRSKA